MLPAFPVYACSIFGLAVSCTVQPRCDMLLCYSPLGPLRPLPELKAPEQECAEFRAATVFSWCVLRTRQLGCAWQLSVARVSLCSTPAMTQHPHKRQRKLSRVLTSLQTVEAVRRGAVVR